MILNPKNQTLEISEEAVELNPFTYNWIREAAKNYIFLKAGPLRRVGGGGRGKGRAIKEKIFFFYFVAIWKWNIFYLRRHIKISILAVLAKSYSFLKLKDLVYISKRAAEWVNVQLNELVYNWMS